MNERRKTPRRVINGCRADVLQTRLFRYPKPLAHDAALRNLSLTGMLLQSSQEIPKGVRVDILILGHRSVMSFRVSGKIRWVDREQSPMGRGYYLAGIEFASLPTGARRHVERLMAETRVRTKSGRWSDRPSSRWSMGRPRNLPRESTRSFARRR